MEEYIGCDAHKKYSVFVSMNERGEYGAAERVSHEGVQMQEYLRQLPQGRKIAVEASGSYYWLVDQMEAAGHEPHLADPRLSKRRMEGRNKTDQKDAQGLAMLLRNGTLPQIWIPPRELRDERELLRLRMYLAQVRTGLKNRIHGTLLRYNVQPGASDLFGAGGRQELAGRLPELPPHTRASVEEQLLGLDFAMLRIDDCERRLELLLANNAERDLLKTMPGVGPILSAVIALEIGDVKRFGSAERLVSYAGLVPVIRQSAQKRRLGQCAADANQYLRWALVEAANVVVLNQRRWAGRHAVKLYQRVKRKTNVHGKAVVAVARHLGEAAYWILSKQEMYKEPKKSGSGSFVEARVNAACA